MKKYLIIISLLLYSGSYAQPVINSLSIDEMNGELHILGKFGTVKGKVTIDSIEMPVKSWADSEIISFIPDTGKGSVGPVVVESSGIASKITMISSWTGGYSYMHTYRGSLEDNYGYGLRFTLRMDLHSILRYHYTSGKTFIPQKNCLVTGYSHEGYQVHVE